MPVSAAFHPEKLAPIQQDQFQFESDDILTGGLPVGSDAGKDSKNPGMLCFRQLRAEILNQKVVPLAPLSALGIPAGTPAIEIFEVPCREQD